MRSSLLIRFLTIGLLIVTASIVGTVWITTSAVTQRDALQVQQDARHNQEIVSSVQKWAGKERSWSRVGPLLDRLSQNTGRRIALLDDDGRVVADTNPSLPAPSGAGVPIDPLAQTYTDTLSPISTTVSGAFALAPAERSESAARAEAIMTCSSGNPDDLRTWPNGRVVVKNAAASCEQETVPTPYPEEQRALTAMTDLTNTCLRRQALPPISTIELDVTSAGAEAGISLRAVSGENAVALPALQRTRGCVTTAWSTLNRDLVPPRVSLITTDLRGDQTSLQSLTTDSLARIAAVAVGLIVMSGVLVLAASGRAVRRIRRLQTVTERLRNGEASARSTDRGKDEVALLGAAINDLAEEVQRVRRQQTQMTADIAHDLRTPLTNIRGWIEAWRDGVADHEDEVLNVVDGEAQHLQRLVADLQTVALADAHEIAAERSVIDLAPVLRAVVAAHGRQGPCLVYDGPITLPVLADAGQLRQVFDNLVANALVHAGATMIVVRAKVRPDVVEVTVEDDGCGVDPSVVDQVFDRLWQADRSRSRGNTGHGLGLTIARRLMELHGGTVTLSNRTPQGTICTVRMPAEAERA